MTTFPTADETLDQLGDELLQAIREAVVDACERSSNLSPTHPNPEPTAVWRLIHSDLRTLYPRHLSEFIESGRVRVVEDQQLLLVCIDGEFALRTHYLPPGGSPSRNTSHRSTALDNQDQSQLPFPESNSRATTILKVLYEVDPAMEEEPIVHLACMIGHSYIWRRRIEAEEGGEQSQSIWTPDTPAPDAPLIPIDDEEESREAGAGGA